MNATPLSQIAEWCGGTLRSGDARILVSAISKDTRRMDKGSLYVGIRGERFDGNSFVAQAATAGAAAAIVDSDEISAVPEGFGILRVKDSLHALHLLASAVRSRMNARVVCVTGSNGKTTTKDFTAEVLSSRFRTNRTAGNLNNHIGLPFTIVNAPGDTEATVWEIGMNHPGEILPLAKLARPDIAIITNIGIAHIEHMGSLEATAQEKGSLLEALNPEGVAILNAGDKFCDTLAARTQARTVRVGIGHGDIRASRISQSAEGCEFTVETPSGKTEAKIPVPGIHMVINGLFAIAAGMECGISLEDSAQALSHAKLTSGRLELKNIRGVLFLDDTYNANPDSMDAALATLAKLPTKGRRIAALGRMGELGSHAESGYRRVGKSAAQTVDALVAVGGETALMAETAKSEGLGQVVETADTGEAAKWLREFAREGDVILVKGSRSAKMENVIGGFQ